MQECRGILLCGGEGTRLYPLTRVANKHLLRIGKRVMVDYVYDKFLEAGISKLHVVCGGENWAQVPKYLGSGKDRGVEISYSIQDKAGGIAEALSLCKVFAGSDKVCVILGDNLFDISLREYVKDFAADDKKSQAYIFTSETKTPERFGILYRGDAGLPTDIIEKPVDGNSSEAVAGIYMYTQDVFDIIKTIRPSARGELEVTDVNRFYLKSGNLKAIKMDGKWTDCGTWESLKLAEQLYG
jgi:glucose-1-phosphate thymidylyltransferase